MSDSQSKNPDPDGHFDWRKLKTEKTERLIDELGKLTKEERYEILTHFCTYCGSCDSGCQCWNDE